MSVESNTEGAFICIECFHRVKSIFKVYQDGFKDIIQCPNCNQLVDSYVECENSVVLIDLILFQKKAYGHILINETIKNILLFKILVTFLLCDAYLQWFHEKNRQFESIQSNDQQLFYALEWNFYFMLIKAVIDYFIYSSIIILVCYVYEKCYLGKDTTDSDLIGQLLKSLILSSFGKMIVIPLVIWNPIDIYFNLAGLFTCLSNLKALTVVGKLNQTKASILVFTSVTLVHMFNSAVDLPEMMSKLELFNN